MTSDEVLDMMKDQWKEEYFTEALITHYENSLLNSPTWKIVRGEWEWEDEEDGDGNWCCNLFNRTYNCPSDKPKILLFENGQTFEYDVIKLAQWGEDIVLIIDTRKRIDKELSNNIHILDKVAFEEMHEYVKEDPYEERWKGDLDTSKIIREIICDPKINDFKYIGVVV